MKARDMNVLLTGATGGIGRCTAERLAAGGASLLLTARNEARLAALGRELSRYEGRIEYVAADIATSEGRTRIADAARRFDGGINVLINNAAINEFGAFDQQSASDVASVIQTNAVAPISLTHSLLPELQHRDEAAIVNVGSIIGSIGLPGQVAYCSSKFALHGFSEALRRELKNSRIDVVYVAPRTTDTDLNDAELRAQNGRLGVAVDDAAVVARRIVTALEGRRRETFLGWPERLFVKLNACLPGLVDRAVHQQADMLFQERLPQTTPATHEGAKP